MGVCMKDARENRSVSYFPLSQRLAIQEIQGEIIVLWTAQILWACPPEILSPTASDFLSPSTDHIPFKDKDKCTLPGFSPPAPYTWGDDERVALLELNSLTVWHFVTKKDVPLFPWQQPILVELQVLGRWRDQPEDLQGSLGRDPSMVVDKTLFTPFLLFLSSIIHPALSTHNRIHKGWL